MPKVSMPTPTVKQSTAMLDWLIKRFGMPGEQLSHSVTRWSWRSTQGYTHVYFQYEEDAVLFKLTWL